MALEELQSQIDEEQGVAVTVGERYPLVHRLLASAVLDVPAEGARERVVRAGVEALTLSLGLGRSKTA